MVKSEAWKWEEVTDSLWVTPSEDSYYLAARWKGQGKKRVLDLGTGLGRHAIFFAEHGFQVDATDLSEHGIARLNQVAEERNLIICAEVSDMLTLPYEAESFDALMAYHVIYHTDRTGIEQVMAEITRVMAKGGEVFISFNSLNSPSLKNPKNQKIDEHTVVKTEGPEAGVPHYYVDVAEIQRLMVGFEFVRIFQVEEIMASGSGWHYFVLARKL